MKRLLVLAVVLVSSMSTYTRPRMMPASNACPVCTIGNGRASDVVPDHPTDLEVPNSGKATPILF